jgi:hypothetical protein
VQTVIQAVYQADLTAQSASPNKLTSINQDIVSSNKTKDNKTKVVSDLPEVGAVKTILNKKSVSESVYQNKIERKQEKIVPHSSKKIITSQNNLNELKNNNRPKVWDIKAFNIEGYQFVPLEQTLKQLAISYQKKSDGTIVSKERSFSIRIGSRKINGSLKNKLSFEPIIFKGEIYIRARDLTKILDSNYVIVIEDNKLMIKKKRSRGQITGKVLSHLKN